ncbi:MAG: fibronectin type III domain-containing protein, partial [Nitrospinae bacterium]|nr:fibronectin type III domain-containing protein [Nitrospinota bacterium]
SAGNGQVSVSWTSVSGATSYNIYWSTTSGVTKTTGTKITGGTSPYTHSGLTNGTTYYYVVTAVNGYGESGESSQVSGTPMTIAFTGSSNSGYQSNAPAVLFNHSSNGSNIVAVVGMSASDAVVNFITYGGQSMTFIREDVYSNSYRNKLYYLSNAPSGTQNVSVSFGKSGGGSYFYGVVAVATFSGASGIGNHNGASTGSASSISTTINSVTANSFLLDFLGFASGEVSKEPSPTQGQTIYFSVWESFGPSWHKGGYKQALSGGNYSMGYLNGVTNLKIISAVEVKE